MREQDGAAKVLAHRAARGAVYSVGERRRRWVSQKSSKLSILCSYSVVIADSRGGMLRQPHSLTLLLPKLFGGLTSSRVLTTEPSSTSGVVRRLTNAV